MIDRDAISESRVFHPAFLTRREKKPVDTITLIGMPGCGKSTVGVVLAKATGRDFVDTDLLIQEREKKLLQEIIDAKGNEYFQRIEEEVLLGVSKRGAVIATGGSAIYYSAVTAHFKKTGPLVYIRLSLATIEKRLDNIKTRGVTMAPGEDIESLYRRRTPLYEAAADITIDGENKDVETIIEEIIERCGRWS